MRRVIAPRVRFVRYPPASPLVPVAPVQVAPTDAPPDGAAVMPDGSFLLMPDGSHLVLPTA